MCTHKCNRTPFKKSYICHWCIILGIISCLSTVTVSFTHYPTHTFTLSLSIIGKKTEAHFDGAMLWAAARMCFFGFLRCAQIVVHSNSTFDLTTHLMAGDIQVHNTSIKHIVHTGDLCIWVVQKGMYWPIWCFGAHILAGSFSFADRRPLTHDRFVGDTAKPGLMMTIAV